MHNYFSKVFFCFPMEIDTFAFAANGGAESPDAAANGWITDADVILSKAKNLFRQISGK